MARLFISTKEQQFIADITKEFVKDVLGFYVYYFPISMEKTLIDEVYDEAVEKIFENPIKLDCIPDQPERKRTFTQFGIDKNNEFKFYVQPRDLIDKNVFIHPGDFVLFGEELYEINTVNEQQNIFGQAEYNSTLHVTCHLARMGQIDVDTFKQAIYDSKNFKESQVQKVFEQQRGYKETEHNGTTGDVRQMRERLKDDMAPIALGEGPRQIIENEDGDGSEFNHNSDNIYDE